MSSRLRGILQELVGDDTRAAAVVGNDGEVVEVVAKAGGQELQNAAADLAALVKVGAYCGRKLEGGELEYLTATTESLSLLAVVLGPAHHLVALLDSGGNVARARVQIRRRKSEIAEELK